MAPTPPGPNENLLFIMECIHATKTPDINVDAVTKAFNLTHKQALKKPWDIKKKYPSKLGSNGGAISNAAQSDDAPEQALKKVKSGRVAKPKAAAGRGRKKVVREEDNAEAKGETAKMKGEMEKVEDGGEVNEHNG